MKPLNLSLSLILWEIVVEKLGQNGKKFWAQNPSKRKLQLRNWDNNQVKKDLPHHNPNFLHFSFPPLRACLLAIKRAASHSHLDVISSIWRHLEQRREPSQRNESSKRLVGGSLLDPKWCQIKHLFFCPTAPFPGFKSSLEYKLLFILLTSYLTLHSTYV